MKALLYPLFWCEKSGTGIPLMAQGSFPEGAQRVASLRSVPEQNPDVSSQPWTGFERLLGKPATGPTPQACCPSRACQAVTG
jgi:hypothetical protein